MNESENESKARRRYLKRGIYRDADNAKKIALNDISHRLIPSLSYFILAIFAGVVCGLAFLYDSKALLLLTVAVTPFFGPFFGISLGVSTGSFSFLAKSVLKYLLGLLLFSLSAFGVGGFGRFTNQLTAQTVGYFIHVYPMMIITVAVCAFLATILLIRNSFQVPQGLAAGALAGVLLPLGLAAFCLGLQYYDPIFDALKTSLLYGLIGITASLLAFLFSRIFAPRFLMFLLSGIVLLACLFYLLDYTKAIDTNLSLRIVPFRETIDGWINPPTQTPTLVPTVTLTPSISPTYTATHTAEPTGTATKTSTITATMTATKILSPTPSRTNPLPSATGTATASMTPTKEPTPTRTFRPSKTPTPTFAPSATIIYAIVAVSNDVGLLIREAPEFGSNVLKSQNNGALLELLDERRENGGMIWVKVRTSEGFIGWAAQSALRTATPIP